MNTPESTFDFKSAKSAFSRIGFALLAFLISTILVQLAILIPLRYIYPGAIEFIYTPNVLTIFSSLTMYLVGFPVFYLIIRKMNTEAPTKRKCGFGTLAIGFLISISLMYVGTNIGTLVSSLLYDIFKLNMTSDTLALVSSLKWYEALPWAVIIAPLIEELVFRKLILDRTRMYGEKLAMIFSSLLFAFFHTSIEQFFYAFLMGLLLSYLYLRKGKILPCWLLHMVFNFIGGVLPLIIYEFVDIEAFIAAMLEENMEKMIRLIEENLLGYSILSMYSLSLMGMSVAGFILLMIKSKKMHFSPTSLPLPKDSEATVAFTNVGVVLFILFSIVYPFVSAAMG